MKTYEEGIIDGARSMILFWFGVAVGQLEGMGYGRDELKAQVDRCFNAIEENKQSSDSEAVSKAVSNFVKRIKDKDQ